MRHRVVVLQNGSHGTHRDFCCLVRHLRALENPPMIVEASMNEKLLTDDGVVKCGERLAREVASALHNISPPPPPLLINDEGAKKKKTHVELSFVAHSMGGLIVREALPQLARVAQRQSGCMHVEWKMFCSVATPHAGTCQMDAVVRSYLGRLIGRVYSVAYHDMFLQSNVLTERLISSEHLAALAAFEHRLLVSSINDVIVPLMSSGFTLKPSQRSGVRGNNNNNSNNNIHIKEIEEETAALCATSEEEMYTKRRRITELTAEEWPHNMYPTERCIVESMLKKAGPFDSIVVDFSRLHEQSNNSVHVRHVAEKLSHRALICKEPVQKRGLDDVFGFVSRWIANNFDACRS